MLTRFLITCCKTKRRNNDYAYLQDLMHPQWSVIITVQQYLSSLLFKTSEPNRLIILAGLDSYDNVIGWASKADSRHMRLTRRAIMFSAGSIHSRHTLPLKSKTLLKLGDDRYSQTDHQLISADFLLKGQCCHMPGTLDWRLKKSKVNFEALQSMK